MSDRVYNIDTDLYPEPQQSVLDEAAYIITGPRRAQYGPANESFSRIAALWAAYTGAKIDAHDVAAMMVLFKVDRARSGYHRDSAVDIIGYAALMEVIENGG